MQQARSTYRHAGCCGAPRWQAAEHALVVGIWAWVTAPAASLAAAPTRPPAQWPAAVQPCLRQRVSGYAAQVQCAAACLAAGWVAASACWREHAARRVCMAAVGKMEGSAAVAGCLFRWETVEGSAAVTAGIRHAARYMHAAPLRCAVRAVTHIWSAWVLTRMRSRRDARASALICSCPSVSCRDR